MQRRLPIIAGVIVVAAAIGIWKCRAKQSDTGDTATTGSAARTGSATPLKSRPRPDPKTLPKGAIAGTITAEGGGPVAKARVCAVGRTDSLPQELLRDPICTLSTDAGAYELANLLPARYVVSASAKPYRPAVHHPNGDPDQTDVVVAANDRKTNVDIALRTGGVELTGVVSDLTGGTIANARVWAREGWEPDRAMALTETDEHGKFSLWVKSGRTQVDASADGYSDGRETLIAPGKVELLLTPESSFAGTAVDAATNQPVEGARVRIVGTEGFDRANTVVTSDAQGKFRLDRITPGRYQAIAAIANGYGRSEGSTLVGLGQHVDGVVVKLWPAHRIEGKVVVSSTKEPCKDAGVGLHETARNEWAWTSRRDDGSHYAEGVQPGTYKVSVSCDGFQPREKYEPVTIVDKDVTGLVWEVDAGATVRGRVRTKSGAPVEGALVWARATGGAPRARSPGGGDETDREGRYELLGLKGGAYKLDVSIAGGAGPKDGVQIEVPAGGSVERDLTLDEVGKLAVTVADAEGKPVVGIGVSARSLASEWGGEGGKTDDTGAVTLDGLRAGEYRVTANRGFGDQLRRPGTTDDAKQGERTVVRAGQTATVRLVVEAQSATIKGTVVDASGKPLADAFVSAARESDAAGSQRSSVNATRWTWSERPVLTSTDGAFTIAQLSPGSYTVRAYRRGGGEAIAEHVAAGATAAKLQIKATGSIEGVVKRSSGAPIGLEIEVKDPKTGFSRREEFFRTEGRFAVRDLPGAKFELLAKTEGGLKKIEVELAEGEAKTGVVVELGALVTVTGRLVEHLTQKPVPGMRMTAQLATGGGMRMDFDDESPAITDEGGRFTIKNAPTGKLVFRGWPKDLDGDFTPATAMRNVDGTGTVDVGDIVVIKRRIKRGEPVGDLGITFAQQPPGTPPDKRERKVSFIDPAGPAAKSGLEVGDIIVSIDGVDIRGDNAVNALPLLRAPPGTKLVLGLARNATVTIVLAAPS